MTDLLALDALALAALLERRAVSAEEVMAATLDRIAAINPGLNAIVSLRPADGLLAEARESDRRRAAGEAGGWLTGLPFAVKDLQNTAGIRTTHGSPLHAGDVPDSDDLLPARLRAAGAILIGKTNTPEFGLGSHSYNPVFGVTRNPYDPARSAGGSSGGAAAALAARLVAVADGSDMMGSLRNPAAFCNVYGFRPSHGRVPATPGGETMLTRLSTDGPMARSVTDLAALLDVLAVPDGRLPHGFSRHAPFGAALDRDIAGRRIGWLGDWGGHLPIEPEVLALCEAALAAFAGLGAHVEGLAPVFDAARLWQAWTRLRAFSIAGGKRDLFADPHKRALMKPELVAEIEHGLALSAMEVHAAGVIQSDWFAAAAGLFDRFDVLALPSAQLFAFPAEWTWPRTVAGRAMDSYHRWMEVVVPASLAGLPTLSVPVGFSAGGLPMGLQLIGRHGADADVLAIGQAWHRATDWPRRRPPQAPPSNVASAP